MKRRKKVLTSNKEFKISPVYRLGILIVTLILLVIIWPSRESFKNLEQYGLIGIFFINFISNATVLVPLPGVASIILGGAIWNPFLVAIVSAIGATLGELMSYFVGYGGRAFLNHLSKTSRWTRITEYYFHKGGFVAILLFAISPIPPFDIIGLIAGSVSYPVWKFAIATLAGKFVRNVVIALSGDRFIPS